MSFLRGQRYNANVYMLFKSERTEERSLKVFVGTVKLISLFFKLNVLIILVTALPVH